MKTLNESRKTLDESKSFTLPQTGGVHMLCVCNVQAAVMATFNFSRLTNRQKARLQVARFGYMPPSTLYTTARKNRILNLEMPSALADEDVPIATKAYGRKRPHKRRINGTQINSDRIKPWWWISVDAVGPFQVPTIHGAVGAFIFTCLRSTDRKVKLYKARSDYPAILKGVLDEIAERDLRVRYITSDVAPEFTGKEARIVADEYGVTLDNGSPYTPQENAAAENSVGIISSTARALMLGAGEAVPQSLIGLAYIHAEKLVRLRPQKRLGWKTAYEIVEGHKPDFRTLNLHVFFCPCLFGLTLTQRMALGGNLKCTPKFEDGYYVGCHGPSIMVYTKHDQKIRRVSYTKVYCLEASFAQSWQGQGEAEHIDSECAEHAVTMIRSDQISVPKTMQRESEDATDKSKASRPSQTPQERHRETNRSANLSKVAQYRGKNVMTPDGIKGIVTDARRMKRGAQRRWILQVTYDDGDICWRPEREVKDNLEWQKEQSQAQVPDKIVTENEASTAISLPKRPRRATASYAKRKSMGFIAALMQVNDTTLTEITTDPDIQWDRLRTEPDPKSIMHGLLGADWYHWWKGAKSEYEGWLNGQVVIPVHKSERAQGAKTIHSRVVCTRKFNKKTGEHIKNKVRCAVRGDFLREGIDYGKTFSATAGPVAVRLVLVTASWQNTRSGHLERIILLSADVSQAYLNAQAEKVYYVYIPVYAKYAEMSLKEIIAERKRLINRYEKDPKGFEKEARIPSDMSSDYVWLCRAAAYGAPDSGRLWASMLSSIMIDELGMHQNKYEPCIYWKGCVGAEEDGWIIVACYVDDLLISGTETMVGWFKDEFQKHAKFGECGPADTFVGLAINFDSKGRVKLTAPGLIQKMVDRNSKYLSGRYAKKIPSAPGRTFSRATDAEFEEARHFPLPHIVGACLFLTQWCRPDCAAITAMLSCHMQRWSMDIADAAIDLLLYLGKTSEDGIAFGYSTEPRDILVAWADSDLGKDESRRARTGVVVKYGGGPVDWLSTLQDCNVDDITSAEIKAASKGAKRLLSVYNIARHIGGKMRPRTIPILFGDNMAAVTVCNNPGAMGNKVRHLELSAFFVRDMIMSSRIFYGYMKSIKMRADILTKNCPAPIHNLLRTAICGYDFITRNATKL